MECDLYRVEQGNKRHSDITVNKKTKSSHHTSATEPKEIQSFDETRSRVECTTEMNAILCDVKMASKSSNVCDNYANQSHMTCDYGIISDKGANKETSLSCKCIVQLSPVDGSSSSTQQSCSCRAPGDGPSGEHCDNKCGGNYSTDLLDKVAVETAPPLPTHFLIEHLSLSVTSDCVQQLDELVKHFLTPAGNRKPTGPMNTIDHHHYLSNYNFTITILNTLHITFYDNNHFFIISFFVLSQSTQNAVNCQT